MYAEIDSRSGLARKHMVSVFNRIIDPNYRGILYNLVYNNSSKPFRIKSADKIAQIIFSSVPEPCIQTTTTIVPTERGNNGFGNTGMNVPSSVQSQNDIITQRDIAWSNDIYNQLNRLHKKTPIKHDQQEDQPEYIDISTLENNHKKDNPQYVSPTSQMDKSSMSFLFPHFSPNNNKRTFPIPKTSTLAVTLSICNGSSINSINTSL